jgi:CO dehydrogenase maturation factor
MADQQTPGKRLIAVCGKGGVGKTAFTSMTSRVLRESGRAGKLLIIDADPAMGLPNTLGVTVSNTMGQVRENIIETARGSNQEEKAHLANMIDYMALEALYEGEDFALLAMGRTETLGCYCPVNSILRGTIETLSRSFDTILIDGEAGLEQLNRQVMRRVDTLILVSDPTSRGIQTAELIQAMVREEQVIQCERMGLVFNRVQGNEELLKEAAGKIGIEVFGFIPQDETIGYHDLVGKPLVELPGDTPGLQAVREIVENRILG